MMRTSVWLLSLLPRFGSGCRHLWPAEGMMRRAQSLVHCDAGAAGGRAIPIFGYAWTDLQGGLGWVRCPRVSEDVHAHGEPSTACHPCGPWLPLIPSYRLVEEGGDILFLVPVCCTEHHHSILDGECIEVVQHDVVGLRKQCWVTRDARVLVQDDLQQVWREDGRGFEPLFWFRHVRLLVVGSWGRAGQLRHIGALLGIHH